jgi:hypothetical protein
VTRDRDPIDGDEAFREELEALLSAAEAGDVSQDAVAGLLTLYLARIRGDVRLPLGMEPDRARRFRERAAEHVGETMELELQVSTELLEEMALQLSAFETE